MRGSIHNALPLRRFPLKVLITDADAAMTSAVRTLLPRTVHLHCLWHVMKNVRKHCQGALKDKANRFFRLVYAAAFATSQDVSTLAPFEPDWGPNGVNRPASPSALGRLCFVRAAL